MGEIVVADYEWFIVRQLPQKKKRKTRDYAIISKSNALLGWFVFHSPWRQHVLRPHINSLWNAGCLTDVTDFLNKLKKGEVEIVNV